MKSCSKIIQLSVLLSSFVTLWYILPGELQVCECSSHRDRFILTRWFVFVYTAKNFSLWQCLETRSQSLFQSILQSRKYFRYLKQYKSLLFTHKLEFSLFLSFFLKCFKCKKKECLVPMALKWYLPVPELRKKRDEGWGWEGKSATFRERWEEAATLNPKTTPRSHAQAVFLWVLSKNHLLQHWGDKTTKHIQ